MNHITSPDTSDAGIERLIQAKGKTAPRVTPADIEANIVSEHYFTAGQAGGLVVAGPASLPGGLSQSAAQPASLDLLTFCVLVLRNGFAATGTSACASPENFDAEIGRKVARQKALEDVWMVMGYELRSRLSAQPEPEPDFLAGSQACNLEDGTCEACQ